MQLTRAWLTLGLSMLVGCGGTFTREGEQPSTGGSAGVGSSGGSPARGGSGGSGASGGSVIKGGTGNGGDAGYGAYGGDFGGYSGDVSYGGTAGYAGDISYGGTAGYGASSGDAGEAGVGGGCGPSTTTAGPYPVKFSFISNTPVYVKEDCLLNYELFSCNSGAVPFVREASCVADCSNTASGCLACGACPSGAKLIGPGAPLQDYWDGSIYKYGTLPSGCACATAANAAPGTYSLVISEFFSESEAMTNTNPYPRTVQFELPAPNGVVTVDLGFQGI